MSLFQKWGIGAELIFEEGRAVTKMGKARQAVLRLRGGFESLRSAATNVMIGAGKIGLALTPLGLAFGAVANRASGLAATLEAQKLTMRTLVGDYDLADQLLARIVENAAQTPFSQGDLIEGSKRLLRLTGSNIDQNMELLKVMETMSALNPDKSVVDSVEALLDATSGGGFERLKEFGISMRAEDFKSAGRPGGKAWGDAVIDQLTKTIAERTNGADLVGQLSQTFTGRMSTLKDGIDQILIGIGEVINRRIGPLLEPLTKRIAESKDEIIDGFELLADKLEDGAKRIGPTLAWLSGMLGGLSRGVKVTMVAAVAGLGALSAAGLAVGGVLGVLGLALSGLIGMFTALLPLLAPEALAAAGVAFAVMAAGAALAAVALGGMFAALREEGEGPLETMARLFTDLQARAMAFVAAVRPPLEQVAAGFLEAFGPGVREVFGELGDSFTEVGGRVSRLFQMLGLGAGGLSVDFVELGKALAEGMVRGLRQAAGVVELMLMLFDQALTAVGPLILAFQSFAAGLIGFANGSHGAETAFTMMLNAVVGGVFALINVVAGSFLGLIEAALRIVETLASAIPGLSGVGLGGDTVAGIRRSLSDTLAETIANTSAGAAEVDATRTKKAEQVVKVKGEDLAVSVDVVAPVTMDGREVGKAQGAGAVRAGERGAAPKLAPRQRGRVLRSGLEVGRLQPTEVI